jgi:hypothetical protein
MNFQIEKATVEQAKAKIAFVGPAGAGKTYTSLVTAQELGEKILVIDTENRTSSKYANKFSFDILPLPNYAIQTYIDALSFVSGQDRYDVVIVDSLSHAWAGEGGALEQAELAGRTKYKGNKFAGWADITPLQNRLINTILSYPSHLIATMRMKIEYALVTVDGKQVPQKLGLGIVQRDSFEYEFDVIGQMDVEHNLMITKTRCFELDGFMSAKPDGRLGQMIKSWLSDGAMPPPSFDTLDDLLYQINLDFGLEESKAKETLKRLGFTGWPTNGDKRQKSAEMYQAVKREQESK